MYKKEVEIPPPEKPTEWWVPVVGIGIIIALVVVGIWTVSVVFNGFKWHYTEDYDTGEHIRHKPHWSLNPEW
jgi:hypothetical protein